MQELRQSRARHLQACSITITAPKEGGGSVCTLKSGASCVDLYAHNTLMIYVLDFSAGETGCKHE
jgi:hypothetical protein